jgi:DNA-binding CsgD family transcriptional regulator
VVDLAAAERALLELLALERELVEADYVRRSDALERVADAVRRLGEIGSPHGILVRAVEELGSSSEFDRVLIGEVREDGLHARGLWSAEAGVAGASGSPALEELRRAPVPLEYPSIEDEVVRHQRTEIVPAQAARSRAAPRLSAALGWTHYVVTALVVQGRTVGLIHADAGGRQLDALDAEVIARYAEGLAGVFERAVLREMLRLHHDELRSGVAWMSARLGQLSSSRGEWTAPVDGTGRAGVEALTARELDVLRLLARGQTNLEIAQALVVREGTVKYHVKNILRKLGARSRADAVSRYARSGQEATR